MCVGGALTHLTSLGHWTCSWIYHRVCDGWPVRSQTYGYFPDRWALPIGQLTISCPAEGRKLSL